MSPCPRSDDHCTYRCQHNSIYKHLYIYISRRIVVVPGGGVHGDGELAAADVDLLGHAHAGEARAAPAAGLDRKGLPVELIPHRDAVARRLRVAAAASSAAEAGRLGLVGLPGLQLGTGLASSLRRSLELVLRLLLLLLVLRPDRSTGEQQRSQKKQARVVVNFHGGVDVVVV